MTVEEIKTETLSTGAVTPNCVYRANQNTTLITKDGSILDVKKGAKSILSGCGRKESGIYSHFMIGIEWAIGINKHWDHYANPILQRVNE